MAETTTQDQPEEPEEEPASEPEPEHVGKFTNPRQAVVDLLRKRLEAALQDVEGGAWDGIRVVTAKDLAAALEDPLPPASLNAAEVRTPAWITVAAVCPRCGISSDVSLEVHPELVVDNTGAELRLKAKSRARTHVCGQTRLEDAAEDGQQGFELTDIVERCPFPRCLLESDHKGDHELAAEEDELE